ncbi:MAG: DUF6414 family protein, partial [Nocardioides sp.]
SATPSAGLTSRLSSSQTTAQEVVRRAVVQGTFRGLRIGDTDLRLSIEDQEQQTRPKPATTSAELAGRITKLAKQRRAVRVCDLNRGDVVELRINLSAEQSYQITAAVTSMLDLLKGRSAKFGVAESALADAEMISELLRRLLVDLVPIAACVTSHRHVVINDVRWVVDATLIAPGSPLDSEAEDVTLVGVTELPLYWKDVRRVLFDGSSYSAYVRLAKPGMRTSWSPVKLANLFDRLIPGLGDQLRGLARLFNPTSTVDDGHQWVSVPDILCAKGLIPFGRQLGLHIGHPIDETALESVAGNAARRVVSVEDLNDIGVVRTVFDEVVRSVAGDELVDREFVRQLRETHQSLARTTVELDLANQTKAEPEEEEPAHLLEVEFVAIYW